MESEKHQFKEEYHAYLWKKIVFIVVLFAAIILLVGYSITVSSRGMSFTEGMTGLWNVLTGAHLEYNTPEYYDADLVKNTCLPRVVAALVCGAGLAICGAVLQTVLNNPLAEPYTLGISSGAVFGACLAIVLGASVVGAGQYAVVGNAFIFGMIPALFLIVLIGTLKGVSPVTMILAGTAISYFFSGLTTLVMSIADDNAMFEAFTWQVGSLDRFADDYNKDTRWSILTLMTVATIICSILIGYFSRYLNAMATGDKSAVGLGVDVNKVRYATFILTTVVTAVLLSFTGLIGFVGLLAPHMVRLIIGNDNKFVIPGSLCLGAFILLFADTISRLLSNVYDVPVGVVMMFIGSPVFLAIMLSRRNGRAIY